MFEHNESYAHKLAKEVLLGWLKESGDERGDFYSYPIVDGPDLKWRPNGSVGWVEYPFCDDGVGQCPVWDEIPKKVSVLPDGSEVWDEVFDAPPTFDECILFGYIPRFIADIALRHKGVIIAVIEVIHSNPPSHEKVEFFRKNMISLYTIDAWWILKQTKRPPKLKMDTLYRWA